MLIYIYVYAPGAKRLNTTGVDNPDNPDNPDYLIFIYPS